MTEENLTLPATFSHRFTRWIHSSILQGSHMDPWLLRYPAPWLLCWPPSMFSLPWLPSLETVWSCMWFVSQGKFKNKSQRWNFSQFISFSDSTTRQVSTFTLSLAKMYKLFSSGGCRQWPTTTSRPWRSLTRCWPCSASHSSSGRLWCSAGTSRSSCVSSAPSCRLSR